MSYEDGRTEGGQFLQSGFSSASEQSGAGVNHHDSLFTAHGKVQDYRRSMGLDPDTGLLPNTCRSWPAAISTT